MSDRTTTRRAWLAAGVAAALVLGSGVPAFAGDGHRDSSWSHHGREIAVATYNIDLGTNLKPVFDAKDVPTLVAATATAYAEVAPNDFPARARALAKLIARAGPDIVGLQEVALWQTSSTGPNGPWTTSYDYLTLLLDALAAQHEPYVAVIENNSFDGKAPATIDFVNWVQYTDRNVVIVRQDAVRHGLRTATPLAERYVTSIPVDLPAPLPDVALTRGWASIDVTTGGDTFRFLTTHLEAYGRFNGDDLFRNAQAVELLKEAATSPHPVIITGDINSRPTGCTPPNTNTVAYGLIATAGYTEVWPAAHRKDACGGYTSGQDGLDSPVSSLDHRIDVIFFPATTFRATRADVIGDRLRDKTRSGLWPSDHAGSVATLQVLRGHDHH